MIPSFLALLGGVGWLIFGLALFHDARHPLQWLACFAMFLLPAGLVIYFAWRAFRKAVRSSPPVGAD